jgi:hypothetical protein
MDKLFECFWGAGYRDEDNKSKLAYHPLEFFSIDNGYEPKDINNIKDLYIGEDYNLDNTFQQHWIRRIS